MLRRIVCLAVVAAIIVGPAFAQPQQLIFKKVDYYWVEGEDEKDEDARLVLDQRREGVRLQLSHAGASCPTGPSSIS